MVQFHRSVCRYQSKKKPDLDFIESINALAAERPRFGYPRDHGLLKAKGVRVNRKRVYLIYRGL